MHRSIYMLMMAGAVAIAHPADAQEVLTLKATVTDADGRITIGDLFDNAGGTADVVLGTRTSSTAVLDAGKVQSLVRQAGASWSNPKGLRRIIVSTGSDGAPPPQAMPPQAVKARGGVTRDVLVFTRAMNTGDVISPSDIAFQPVQSHMASGSLITDAQSVIGKSVKLPLREGGIVRISDLTSPTVIKRAEMVRVTWDVNGMSLSMSGIAQKEGAVGDVILIQNPQSKKLIEAVVTGPGTAVTGDAAQRLRVNSLYSFR